MALHRQSESESSVIGVGYSAPGGGVRGSSSAPARDASWSECLSYCWVWCLARWACVMIVMFSLPGRFASLSL